MNNKRSILMALIVLLITAAISAQTVKVDSQIPKYEKKTGIKGNLNSIGSDTILNMMTLWGEAFKEYYPEVKIQIEGKVLLLLLLH